jgi:hypothetical protein
MQLSWTPRAAAHWQRAAQQKRLFSELTESVEKDGRCNNCGFAQKFAERGIDGVDDVDPGFMTANVGRTFRPLTPNIAVVVSPKISRTQWTGI